MKHCSNSRRTKLLRRSSAFAMSAFIALWAFAAAPRVDESQLSGVGFKVLVATNKVQEEWVKSLEPGRIRPMQRNGKKYFIYPDAPRNQIYIGGPNEYAAYQELHPESQVDPKDAANKANAYRYKQDDAMRKASARDLSNPFLGASWSDLGW
jgi:hypothetical protein